jgi:hypothetical protein
LTAWLTAAGVTPRSAAATVKLRRRATVVKATTPSSRVALHYQTCLKQRSNYQGLSREGRALIF